MTEATAVSIKEGTKTVSCYAFANCTALREVTLPSSLEVICNNAFSNCTGLTDIILPDNLTIIADSAFQGCTGFNKITLPDKVEQLGAYSFSDCTNVDGINFGSNLETIGNYAFKGCKISRLVIPDNIMGIGDYAFQNCSLLSSVIFGNNLNKVGSYIFHGCSNISSLYIFSKTPPELSFDLYSSNSHYNGTTIYIPNGTLRAYQSVNIWNKFKKMREGNYTAIKETEADTPSFEITAEGIRLKTAESIEVTIYTTNGTLVERIDNYTGESIILDKGIYILKAGNKTMKIRL
jgi:hypothetical protein